MEKQEWTTIIKPKTGWFDININELIRYKELIWVFIKRNFTTMYKQTILGPLWIIITPLISTAISTFVFGTIAGIKSDGVPYFIFYMAGSTAWGYFSRCFTATSSTFTENVALFGKVYFPRLAMPISTVITSLLNFIIQMVLMLGFTLYFNLSGAAIYQNWWVLSVPILVLEMAMLGLGCGIIISSLTTKYRDLTVLVSFGVSLWMYITPIIYSTSSLSPKLKALCMLNPVSPIVETFRYAFLGIGEVPLTYLGISFLITCAVLFVGVIIFSRVEKTYMDTV